MPKTPPQIKHPPGLYSFVSSLFARSPVSETIVTSAQLNASPETVWNHIMFYEEVPGRVPFLLRALLPHPVRTEGNKACAGATVRCEYSGGDLLKRITAIEAPHSLQFEVSEQRLGIESCVRTLGGSYEIHRRGEAATVALRTNYHSYLHPRGLWRPVEALLVRQLHRHILHGLRKAILSREPALRPTAAQSFTPE